MSGSRPVRLPRWPAERWRRLAQRSTRRTTTAPARARPVDAILLREVQRGRRRRRPPQVRARKTPPWCFDERRRRRLVGPSQDYRRFILNGWHDRQRTDQSRPQIHPCAQTNVGRSGERPSGDRPSTTLTAQARSVRRLHGQGTGARCGRLRPPTLGRGGQAPRAGSPGGRQEPRRHGRYRAPAEKCR
jgi:hypothetical protein